jgi:diguanylate cyclase (GGDEF)-like protein
VGLALAALGVAVHVAVPTGFTGTASYLAVTVTAATAATVGALRRPSEQRLPWLLLAVGVSLSALADCVFEFISWRTGTAPVVSIADVPWLSAYVGLGTGLVVLERRARHNQVDVDGLIDSAAVATVAMLVVWELSIGATVADGSVTVFDRLVMSAYPVSDAVLLALAARLLFTRAARDAVGWLLGLGVMLWLAGDVGFLLEPASPWTRWQDATWMLGAALMSAAVWRHPSPESTTSVQPVSSAASWPRIAFAVALLAAPGVVDLVGYVDGEDLNPVPLATAGVVLCTLVFVRALRLLRSRDAAGRQLAASERRYRALAVHASDTLVVLDAGGRILDEAPNLGVRAGSIVSGATRGASFADLFDGDRSTAATLLERAVLSPGEVCDGELMAHGTDGGDTWIAARLVNLLGDSDVGGVIVDLQDVTARHDAELLLEHQAYHDPLTGLANRSLFHDRAENAIARSTRSGSEVAVIYLDLDGFKTVNDSLGHEAGDVLLRVIAQRVRDAVRDGDTVARLGGDEFAVLVEGDHAADEATEIAERILDILVSPVSVEGHLIGVTASLGIAVGDPGSTASTLLRNADTAMYQAKSRGRARWVLFEPAMRFAAVARLRLESDLAVALERDELRLMYQPVVALDTGEVVGFEALVRWDHPRLGVISPDGFIPIAEETGLILPIGRWVLETACAASARWRTMHPDREALSMAVNVSARQLLSVDFVDSVAACRASTGIALDRLVVELTESVLVADPGRVAAQLHRLRDLGVRIAIDDFGTGYSSLSYLRQFPVDILKIDGSFVATITDSDEVPALLRGLLEFGHALDLVLVAEGVERPGQLEALREQHCDQGQGFLLGRPLEAWDVDELLRTTATPVTVESGRIHG